MNELEKVWTQKLAEARAKAETAGRADVAEYLTLRTTNDMLRQTSIGWLLESLLEIAAVAVQEGARISIETDDQHRFQIGNANLAGALVRLSQGVRCLTVEAGWTRVPADGFMRGGALALGRVSHFGISKHNVELLLVLQNNAPSWFSVDRLNHRELFNAQHLQEHFRLFLD